MKSNRQCSAGCECRGRTNLQLSNAPDIQEEEERVEENEEQEEEAGDWEEVELQDWESDEETLETEVVTDNFIF